MVEDMLIKVSEFIFSVDFIVLQMVLTPNLHNHIFILRQIILCNYKCINQLYEWPFETIFWEYDRGTKLFNMDEHTMSSLIEVNMVHSTHADSITCVDVESTFE